jgi:hypothetical protein
VVLDEMDVVLLFFYEELKENEDTTRLWLLQRSLSSSFCLGAPSFADDLMLWSISHHTITDVLREQAHVLRVFERRQQEGWFFFKNAQGRMAIFFRQRS